MFSGRSRPSQRALRVGAVLISGILVSYGGVAAASTFSYKGFYEASRSCAPSTPAPPSPSQTGPLNDGNPLFFSSNPFQQSGSGQMNINTLRALVSGRSGQVQCTTTTTTRPAVTTTAPSVTSTTVRRTGDVPTPTTAKPTTTTAPKAPAPVPKSTRITLPPSLPSGMHSNWAGYTATGQTFTAVYGSWVQPSATCSTKSADTQTVGFWVGIDGALSEPVEQLGSAVTCSAGSTKATYGAWYDMFPDAAVDLGAAYPVVPGDVFNAYVTYNGPAANQSGSFTLGLRDTSTTHPNWTFTITKNSQHANESSAEWVMENAQGDPFGSYANGPSFAPVTFFNCYATAGGVARPINGYATTKNIQVNPYGTTLGTPGPLSSSGTGFSVSPG